MGCVYKHKNRSTWWIKYRSAGRWQYESAKSHRKGDAERLLKLREGDVVRGVSVTSAVGRMRFEEARDDLITYHKANSRETKKLEGRIALHLTPYFAKRKMADITGATVNTYIARRREAGPAPATINRELAWLKHMFTLAIRAGKLTSRPHIALLREDNARQGFFEYAQYQSVLGHLPDDLRPVVQFAYLTGWRVKSEVLTLQWRQVDFHASEIRLEPGTTKNKDGRVFPMTTELRAVLERQHADHKALQKRGRFVPWVFHRDGQRIKSMSKAWQSACVKAGCPGRLLHDLRRTAVRNFVRAGVPERVCMALTGHKTRSVFERYNIVSGGDLREAARRLDDVRGVVAVAGRS